MNALMYAMFWWLYCLSFPRNSAVTVFSAAVTDCLSVLELDPWLRDGDRRLGRHQFRRPLQLL